MIAKLNIPSNIQAAESNVKIVKRQTTQENQATKIAARYSLVALTVLAAALVGCAAGERPLSIKMFNAKSNTTIDCTARDLGRADRDMLADTVETCARQLEKNGFVRQSSKP